MIKKIFILLVLTALYINVTSVCAEPLEEKNSAKGQKPDAAQASQIIEVPVMPIAGKASTPLITETSDVSSNKILITDLKSDNVMIEIHAQTRIKDYSIITLASPSRLVIEIKNAESRLGEKVIINKLGIKDAHFENTPAFLKITLEAMEGRIIPIPYRVEDTDMSLNVVVTSP